MLGLENPLHIAIVLIVVLMVFGAKRLPEMGKSMGSGLRGFKDALSGEEPVPHITDAATPDPIQHITADSTPARDEIMSTEHRVPAQPVA